MKIQQGWSLMLGMMMRPRRTMDRIEADRNYEWVVPLAIVSGVSSGVMELEDKHSIAKYGPAITLLIVVLFGALSGWLMLYVWAWLIGVAGRAMGGKASDQSLRAAFAWSNVPVLISALLFIAGWILGGWESFGNADAMAPDSILRWALEILGYAGWLLSLWTLVITVAAVGQVQGFGWLKAFGNLMLAGAMTIVPIGLVILICQFF